MAVTVKSEKQIALMREAGRLLAITHEELHKALKPGMTTLDIDRLGEEIIRDFGCVPNFKNYNGFPASICVSINDEVVHGIPDEKRIIQEGDIVSVDVGSTYKGYVSDAARTYAVGQVDAEAQRLIDVTRQSFFEGIKYARVGYRLTDISHAIQECAESAGFSVIRDFVGHGVGREMHEDPQIPNYGKPGKGPRLVSGMVFAIEPMICQGDYKIKQLSDGWTVKTKDGGLAAHFEHSIAILKDRTEIMTRSWDDPDFDPATFSLK